MTTGTENDSERRYQVFVSSTFVDLQAEREAVLQAILELKAFADGMELFPAANSEQWEFIKKEIESSDYYVVVIAGKYGSLASDGTSYTEKEYNYAVELKKPIFVFLHHDIEKLESRLTESEPGRRKKLLAFRKKVQSGRLVKKYKDPSDLKHQVYKALQDDFLTSPKEGWIRSKAKTAGGLVEFRTHFAGFSHDPMLQRSKEMTIVLNDGRGWVDSNRESLRKRLGTPGMQTTFIFIDPSSDFLPTLLRKNGKRHTTQLDELRRSLTVIEEATTDPANVRVYGHSLFHPYSMYLGDDHAVVMPYFITEQGQLPVLVFENDGRDSSLYGRYKADVDGLIPKSRMLTLAYLDEVERGVPALQQALNEKTTAGRSS